MARGGVPLRPASDSHSDAPIDPLLDAMSRALQRQISAQLDANGPTWYSVDPKGDPSGIAFEVPYGPGPYPDGIVALGHPDRERDDFASFTSLVKAFPVDNPHVGRGLLVTLRPGGFQPDDQPTWWTAALLNEQSRLVRLVPTPGSRTGSACGSHISRTANPSRWCTPCSCPPTGRSTSVGRISTPCSTPSSRISPGCRGAPAASLEFADFGNPVAIGDDWISPALPA